MKHNSHYYFELNIIEFDTHGLATENGLKPTTNQKMHWDRATVRLDFTLSLINRLRHLTVHRVGNLW